MNDTATQKETAPREVEVNLGNLRELVLAEPGLILDDREMMRALVGASETARGENVVDLRGVAMERLESRLERLEDTHRTVLAAAYDNVSGTDQIHRAVLALLDAPDFAAFLAALDSEVPSILRVEALRLVFESAEGATAALPTEGGPIRIVKPGYVSHYTTAGRAGAPQRTVTLRPLPEGFGALYEGGARTIRSEAVLALDLGEERLPAMLVFGAEDARQFSPEQGSDLLTFLAGVLERMLRRWLG